MNYLRALRHHRALTFVDLAYLTGIPARILAEAEYGLRSLSAQERGQLALVFGLPDDKLLMPSSARAAALAAESIPTAGTLSRPVRHALVATALAGAILAASLRPVSLPRLSLPSFTQPQTALVSTASIERALPPAHIRDWDDAEVARTLLAVPEEEARFLQPLAEAMTLPNDDQSAQPVATAAPRTFAARPFHEVLVNQVPFEMTEAGPRGCPLRPQSGQVVITQGYGVGTHAPAEIWGAVDLAVDGNGNGWSDASASLNTFVVATHAGVASVTLDSWPAGNHISIADANGWRTSYSHLAEVLVESGQEVVAGQVIGRVGTTGMSTGPHLDYQVWRGGVNIDPTELVGVCRPS